MLHNDPGVAKVLQDFHPGRLRTDLGSVLFLPLPATLSRRPKKDDAKVTTD